MLRPWLCGKPVRRHGHVFSVCGQPHAEPCDTFRAATAAEVLLRGCDRSIDFETAQSEQCDAGGLRVRIAIAPESAIGAVVPSAIGTHTRKQKLLAGRYAGRYLRIRDVARISRSKARTANVVGITHADAPGNQGQPSGRFFGAAIEVATEPLP